MYKLVLHMEAIYNQCVEDKLQFGVDERDLSESIISSSYIKCSHVVKLL